MHNKSQINKERKTTKCHSLFNFIMERKQNFDSQIDNYMSNFIIRNDLNKTIENENHIDETTSSQHSSSLIKKLFKKLRTFFKSFSIINRR